MSDIMNTPGLINRDFSDIRSIMQGMGHAMMGTASASGENAAQEAAKKAINCPLLSEDELHGAKGILINITASSSISLHDVNEACTIIRNAAQNDDVQVNFGIALDDSLKDMVKITVIATGFPSPIKIEEKPPVIVFETPSNIEPLPPKIDLPEPVAARSEPLEPTSVVKVPFEDSPSKVVDELDVPAYLRRGNDRRLFG
jgi:cell division protein FtsZ